MLIIETLKKLVGENCRVETFDGMIRRAKITNVTGRIMLIDGELIDFPVALVFDGDETDGVEISRIKEISRID